jgi:uncharacterized membrane protein YeaQ/YmgE (transglycosylase-associated protein family)
VFGLVAGVVAKLIMPGKDPGGFIVTTVLGIAGGLLGGFIGSLLGLGSVTGFNFWSFLLAVGGTMILLIGYRLLKKNKEGGSTPSS